MKLVNLKNNMSEILISDFIITFSYETPVQIIYIEGYRNHIAVTKEKFSNTTTRNMNKHCYEPNCKPKLFDKIIKLIDNKQFTKAKNLIIKLNDGE